MLVALIIPEAIIMSAYGQWRMARKIHKAWISHHKIQPKTWLDTFMFWKTRDDDGLGIDGAFFVVMGGFVLDLPPHLTPDLPPEVLSNTPITTTLTPRGFLKYLGDKKIPRDTFDKRSIVDKGKTSNIAKVLASCQALWLLAQCISRWLSNLPLTLLEIHVTIQVLCTILLYTLWWAKPLDVNEPIKITLSESTFPSSGLIPGYNLFEGTEEPEHFTMITPPCLAAVRSKVHVDMLLYIIPRAEDELQWLYLFMEGMLIFTIGALHAAAWNVHFPSNLELWLWRGCSIAMCVFPWAIGAILLPTEYVQELLGVLWKMQYMKIGFWDWSLRAFSSVHGICKRQAKKHGDWIFLHHVRIWICVLFIICYAFSVLFITGEAYASLRSPPEGSFLTPVWSDYWPHL